MRACAESHVKIIVDLRFINNCNEPQPKCQFGTSIVPFGTIDFGDDVFGESSPPPSVPLEPNNDPRQPTTNTPQPNIDTP